MRGRRERPAGLSNDGVDGSPAHEYYGKDGQLQQIERSLDGKLQDSPDGRPAREMFNAAGTRVRAECYTKNEMTKQIDVTTAPAKPCP